MSFSASRSDSSQAINSNENLINFVKNSEMTKSYSDVNFSSVKKSKESENSINVTKLIDTNIQKISTKTTHPINEHNSYLSQNVVIKKEMVNDEIKGEFSK